MGVEHYAIDKDMSKFTVRAFASGMFSAFGHSPTLAAREFDGEAQFSEGTLEKAFLRVNIMAGSLAVIEKISDKDRLEIEGTMNRRVLETHKYPEIVFESSNLSASKAGDGKYWVNLLGKLSLHGVTRDQPVAAQVALLGNTLRAHGEFSLLQTAYRINLISVAGGTLKLKDELKCSFDILARKQSVNLVEQKTYMVAPEIS
ncbi:MAG: YceI family protein [Bryobacteraceae bacterium]